MSGAIIIRRDGYVATVTIDNEAKRNAMSQAMWMEMGDAILDLSTDMNLRCIVVRGAGDQAFGSGADIDEFESIRADKAQATAFAKHGHRAMHAMRDCPIPTVAAIQGACVGGGLELAAFCDMRLCSEGSRFGIPISRLGGTLAYAELEGLMRLAGPTIALELLLEGRVIDASEALAKGMVNRVIPADRFEDEVRKAVARITAGAPLAARWHKKFIAKLRSGAPLQDTDIAEGFACFDTRDYVIGYQAFLTKQTPQFLGQ
ncbi:MAG: Enoyl-CoA hydratase/isomerase [Polaromonas sp.]|nr:Enoyl-CoA hydratase/isomerase [Polaromonas sp.]